MSNVDDDLSNWARSVAHSGDHPTVVGPRGQVGLFPRQAIFFQRSESCIGAARRTSLGPNMAMRRSGFDAEGAKKNLQNSLLPTHRNSFCEFKRSKC